jgi:sugar diacid utilization regulator
MLLNRLLLDLQLSGVDTLCGDPRQVEIFRVAEFRSGRIDPAGSLFLVPDALRLEEARPAIERAPGHAFLLPGDLRGGLGPELLAAARATLLGLPGTVPLDLSARIQRLLDEEERATPSDSLARSRQDLVEDFLLHRYQDLRALMARARGLEVHLELATCVILVGFTGFERYYVQHEHKGEAHFQQLKARIVDIVRREALTLEPGATAVAHGEGAVLLTSGEPGPLGRRIAQSLAKELRFVPLSVAAGGIKASADTLSRSYQEAQLALQLRTRLRLRERFVAFSDLTGYALLQQLQNAPDIVALLEAELAPLLALEYGRKSLLIETMAAFFDAAGSLKLAANRLNIHPKTLRYRLDRIEDVLGQGALESEKRLLYYLAARYHLWARG